MTESRFDLINDPVCRLYGVLCLSDRTAHDNVVRAVQYGLARDRDPNLIIVRHRGPFRTNPRDNNDQVLTDSLFDLPDLRSGADHAGATRLMRPLGPPENQFGDVEAGIQS